MIAIADSYWLLIVDHHYPKTQATSFSRAPKQHSFCPECPELQQSTRDVSAHILTGLSRLSRVVPT